MSELTITPGFYGCGRITDLGTTVYKDDGVEKILEKAKAVQKKCESYGTCSLIPGACKIEKLVTALESAQKPV
jgi:hypothetical protein